MPKEKKEISKEVISNVFSNILDVAEKKHKELYGEIIKKVKIDADSPNTLYHALIYPLENIIELAVKEVVIKNRGTSDDVERASFLLQHSEYIDHNIKGFINELEGSICESDKSGYLVNQLFKNFLLGADINVTPTKETYWIPSFWTDNKGKEWLELFDGLHGMYYGNNKKYLAFMRENWLPLLKTKIKK